MTQQKTAIEKCDHKKPNSYPPGIGNGSPVGRKGIAGREQAPNRNEYPAQRPLTPAEAFMYAFVWR